MSSRHTCRHHAGRENRHRLCNCPNGRVRGRAMGRLWMHPSLLAQQHQKRGRQEVSQPPFRLKRPPDQRAERDETSWERDLVLKGVLPEYLSDYSIERVLCPEHVLSITGDFRHERLFLKQVRAMAGWAVHGLVFEFVDGTRAGYIVGATGYLERNLSDGVHFSDERIQSRGGASDWDVIEPGDYIVEVTGFDLARERQYLCHSITLTFASGRNIHFVPENENWKGKPFQFRTSNNLLPLMPIFYNGSCHGMTSLQTSVHLPFTLQNAPFYPNRDILFHLLKVFKRIDSQHLEKPLGKDVWCYILGMLHSRDIAPHSIH